MIKRFFFYSLKMFLPFLILYLVFSVFPGLSEIWASFLAAWVPYAVAESYRSWPRLQLWTQRVWLHLTQTPVQWMVEADYQSSAAAQLFDKLYKRLIDDGWKKETQEGHKVTLFHPNRFTYLTLEVARTPSPEGLNTHLVVRTALSAPFRTGARALEYLINLFDWVRGQAGGSMQEESYHLRIRFQGRNPYFGLFIHMLTGYEQHLSFQIEFEEKEGRIFVSGRELAIWASTPHNLENLSQRYITLSAYPVFEG